MKPSSLHFREVELLSNCLCTLDLIFSSFVERWNCVELLPNCMCILELICIDIHLLIQLRTSYRLICICSQHSFLLLILSLNLHSSFQISLHAHVDQSLLNPSFSQGFVVHTSNLRISNIATPFGQKATGRFVGGFSDEQSNVHSLMNPHVMTMLKCV